MIKLNILFHIRYLKQTLNHGLILKKIHRVIEFNQKAWPKPYTYTNTKLKKTKNNFEKRIFQADEECNFWKNFGKCEKT